VRHWLLALHPNERVNEWIDYDSLIAGDSASLAAGSASPKAGSKTYSSEQLAILAEADAKNLNFAFGGKKAGDGSKGPHPCVPPSAALPPVLPATPRSQSTTPRSHGGSQVIVDGTTTTTRRGSHSRQSSVTSQPATPRSQLTTSGSQSARSHTESQVVVDGTTTTTRRGSHSQQSSVTSQPATPRSQPTTPRSHGGSQPARSHAESQGVIVDGGARRGSYSKGSSRTNKTKP